MTTSYENDYRASPRKLSNVELLRQLQATQAATLRRGARTSLTDFSRYVYRVEPAEHHRLVLDALEAIERRQITKLVIIAPPGHAKSTYVSVVFPTWYLGRRYNETVIGVTTTDRLGRLYGDTVRSAIEEGERFSGVFPDVVPWRERGWAQDGFFVRGAKRRNRDQKDASMIFTGAGGPVIGRRADGILIDDAIDEATARSEILLETRKTWIARTVFSRLKPGGWRVIAGTLWTEGDVVDSAMQTGEYVTIHLRAISESKSVAADLWIPNGVKWRPSMNFSKV